jgi:hypothetical protein
MISLILFYFFESANLLIELAISLIISLIIFVFTNKNVQLQAIISGCSAGGLTSLLHCDRFRALLPGGAKVKCISDAGYFINV